MDPLSITVSITALLGCVVQIHKGIQNVRNGSSEREQIFSEMQLLHSFLHGLKGRVELAQGEEAWMQPIQELDRPQGAFAQLHSALDQLMIKLGAKPSTEKAGSLKEEPESLRRRFINGVKWSLNAQEAQGIAQRIERLKTTMTSALNQANLILAAETGENVSALKKSKVEQRLQDIIEWLSPLHFRTKQKIMRGVPNTGRWFFQRAEFTDWTSGREPILWCYGIPGSGKTVLASTTVDKLRELHEGQRVAVLTIFCSYDDPNAQLLDNLLASLLKQALQISPNLTPELETLYSHHRKEQSRPSADEILMLFQTAVNQFEKTFLVIDGLDELQSTTDRELLLDHLQDLDGDVRLMITSRRCDDIVAQFGRSRTLAYQCDACEGRLSRVYYFCGKCQTDKCPTCREADASCCETGSLDKKNACRSIKVAAHSEDVEAFILQRIRNASLLSGFVLKREALQGEILFTIIAKAKEMFLLARFFMDSLEEKMTIKQVQKALGHLPEELDETYDQAMQRIHELKGPLQQMVKELLMWVAYAKRPLKITEIEHALAILTDAEDLDEDDVTDITLLTSRCAGLIEIDEAKYLHPTHETVENYFRRNRDTWFPDGESVIAKKCLTYLRMEAFTKGACSGPTEEADFKRRCDRYPLLPYASIFWGDHACHGMKAAGDSMASSHGNRKLKQDNSKTIIQDRMPHSMMSSNMKFLKSKGNLETAVQAMWYHGSRWDARQDVTALHLAAWFGLHQEAAKLLFKGADVDAKDSLGTTPLMYSSARGNAEVNEVLLHSSASTSLLCHRGSTALHRASFNGRPKIVRQLLGYSDVSINTLSKLRQNRSALMLASVKGHVEVVKGLLAQKSIDVNLQSDGKQTALLLAASRGHLEIVKLLLQHAQVEINHQDSYGYTALSQAAEHGQVLIVELLMNHGANPALRDVYGGTAFLRAIDQGKPLVVRKIMKRGVDYTFRDFRGRTALHGAAINNRHRILRMLLENEMNKLDVNVQGDVGETPLHDAARCGSAQCVQILLEYGARTDILDHAKRTPVSVAMMEDRLEVLHLMKEARGTDLVPQTKDWEQTKTHDLNRGKLLDVEAASDSMRLGPFTALKKPFYKAVQFDEVAALEASLPSSREERDRFLDVRIPDSGASALHKAVHYGRFDVVEMLLKAGAKPDPTDYYGYAPLHPAARNNRTDMIECLISHGADPNISNSTDHTPLKAAVQHDAKEAALLLVEKGAAVRENGPQVRILTRWAAELGNLHVIQRLVPLGATFMLKGDDGRNAYEIVRDEGHTEIAQFLLKRTDEFKRDSER